MIIQLRIFLSFFILLLLSACSQMPNELRLAEQLMETRPDSALHILERINPVSYKSPSHRALYGLLYFEALDKKDKPLGPDSLIDFSIAYYLTENEKFNLSKSYFYKARMHKKRQRFDVATGFYLKSRDLLKSSDRYFLLGSIYSDLADIFILQKDDKGALKKIVESINLFNRTGDVVEASYRVVSIGKIYRFRKEYKVAIKYYKQALSLTVDSMVQGYAFQEMGVNYYFAKQNDSAQYYLYKSLRFPYKGTNFTIRCFVLADLMYNIGKMDSAAKYAAISFKYPGTYFNKRDCYRILANCEYWNNNTKQMGKYVGLYQNYSDSVGTIEIQSKASLLESSHNKDQQTAGAKRSMIWITSVLVLVLLFSGGIVYLLFRRNTLKKKQLDDYRKELTQKQEFVTQSLAKKIADARESQAEARKNAPPEERERLDKELYERCLHLSNWEAFSCEMNHAFNQIVDVLKTDYAGITQKEIIWCCLHLLDIPNADRILLLNATADSVYKLKQRLAQKMNLKSTKELDSFLKALVTGKYKACSLNWNRSI